MMSRSYAAEGAWERVMRVRVGAGLGLLCVVVVSLGVLVSCTSASGGGGTTALPTLPSDSSIAPFTPAPATVTPSPSSPTPAPTPTFTVRNPPGTFRATSDGCIPSNASGVGLDPGKPRWPTDTGALCGGYLGYHVTTAGGGDGMQWGFGPDFVGTCSIEIYIPDSPHASAPLAHYLMIDQPTRKPRATGFVIAQAAHHGQWVPVGDYHTTGDFVVRLDDRGDGHSEVVGDAARVNYRRT